ncbi:Uncharacterised protein [Metamycoplasma alkalescens]|uniref:Uncharacterized protein n=1 Tax=Metamycoplasma alkalescens TaxID=45363 RepID=A0A3B0NZV3_9BACT|nr:Uncharacterised protein [Metamycoplasma alkalescens]
MYEVDEIIDSFISILEKIKAEDKNTYLDLDEELKEHLVEILDDIDDFIDIIFDSETNTLILNKSAIDAFGEKDINDVID